jgi:hypothetical protein
MVESVFWPRLRWRMRGAWQWPAFAVLTVVDALLIARLPFQGDGPDAIGALLVAGFANLLAVAVAAPLLGALVRRFWRKDLPRMVARDYAGTALLGLVTVVLVTGGLIHRRGLEEEHRDRAAALAATHNYVVSQAPRFRAGLAGPDIVQKETDLYRVCVYGDESLPLCLYVNTDQRPAGVRRDHSREPNGHN